jgi:hypothetical protein
MRQSGIATQPRYRTVNKADIVEQLVCFGWVYEWHSQQRGTAQSEAAEALEQLVQRGLPSGKGLSGPQFDPVEVDTLIRWLGARDECGTWQRFVTTTRKLIGEFHAHVDEETPPPPPKTLPPRRFAVTYRREFKLGHVQPGTEVRLRSPLPLEDEALRGLKLEDVASADLASDPIVTAGRVEGRFRVPKSRTVAFTWRASFTAYPTRPDGSPARLRPAAAELYTRSKEGLIQVSPRVRALADRLAGSRREPWETVRTFWDFLIDRMTFGALHYDEIDHAHPLDRLLEGGWYDCHLGSALLVALCRARGIPARLISGYTINPRAPGVHYWAEFWDEERGWVPIDTVAAELSLGGRDPLWRDYFFGQLDYRMKTECLPRLFTGTPTVRLPPVWHMLIRFPGSGVETGIFDASSGALVYRDQVLVESVNATPL